MSGALGQGPLFLFCLVFLLGAVVVVHELGHYLAGRMFGAAAESFSVGFGRSIFERTDKRNTRWRINWIPLGGFVKFVGESQMPGDVGKIERGPLGKRFMDLTVGERSIVAVAGPLANFLLAIALFAVIALVHGKPLEHVTIGAVNPGPAADAGLQVGDVIVAIDGEQMNHSADIRRVISLSTGDKLDLTVLRGGLEKTFEVTPVRTPIDNGLGQKQPVGAINVGLSVERYGRQTFNPATALAEGVRDTGEAVATTGKMIARMVTGREPLSQLSGPVGIGDLTRRAVNSTLEVEQIPLGTRLTLVGWTLLQICAYVSVGIGLFNLFPLPVLDGGHLIFNAYEAVTGSVLPAKVQEVSLTFGLLLLLSVAAVVTWGDIIETGIFQGLGA
ncbi:MAG: RIP metalloprotease [Pseudomonadota bacterium]